MNGLETVETVIEIIGFLMGLIVVIITYISYRKSSETHMRNLSIGFAMISSGSILEAVLIEGINLELRIIHLIESAFVIIGFYVILTALKGGSTVSEILEFDNKENKEWVR